MIAALMITYNRLEYTKKALAALINSDVDEIYVIDNGSTDGTDKWLLQVMGYVNHLSWSNNNSIASAMNYFLMGMKYKYCIKVDNDTIIPEDFCKRMLPHMKHADIVQAKHHIIPATNPEGWEGFTRHMKRENGLLYNHFVGGSGIMFKRNKVNHIPETDWVLGGWREFQRQNPQLKKAFCEDVEIKLLDEHGYEDYPEYYKQTGRCLQQTKQ